MNDIEKIVSETYIKNLEFLQDKYYDIWYKLHLFELALESNRYQEKYALEYVNNSYFDVLKLETNDYLYGTDSNMVSKDLTKKVNFRKNSFVFEGFPLYYNYENIPNLDDKAQGIEDIYPLMTYYLDNHSSDKEMREIEKFIFIGIGLGLHVLEIHNKINAEEYFFIEDDLELFKLSLFTTPYYKLDDSKLFFSIAENKDNFTKKFESFLENSFFRNKHLKYSFFPAHSDEKIKLIKNSLSSQSFASFPYKTTLNKYIRTMQHLEKYNFVNLKEHFLDNTLSKKPLLIIAAGPSLDENLEWLKQNHSKFTILALSATLKTLYTYNIKPDIVTHLDGFQTSLLHFNGFPQKDFLKDSIAIFGGFTPKEAIEYFQKENVYIVEDHATYYHENFSAHTGPCVGSTSIMWAITMNFENIFLLGIDLAVSKTGESHSKTHQVTKKKYKQQDMHTLSSQISFRGDFFTVKGNFENEVYTNPLFYDSIRSLNTTIPKLKTNQQTIYNLNNGAYIKGTIPKHIDTIDFDTFSIMMQKSSSEIIKKVLKPYSKKMLTTEDKNSLMKRLIFAQEVKEIITQYQVSVRKQQVNEYLHDIISLILAILQNPTRENANLITVYDYYFNYTVPIIFDFFNTKKLEDETKHIEYIDKIFTKGLYSIQTIYEEALQNYFSIEKKSKESH